MTTPERGLFEQLREFDFGMVSESNEAERICDIFEQRLAEAEAKIVDYRQTMVAAAEEINEHWQAHCDAEGYGPQNLVLRLERGIQAGYDGYSIGMFREKMDEITQLRARCEELEQQLETRTIDFDNAYNANISWAARVKELESTLDLKLADIERAVWKALDRKSCPGIYMQIAAEAVMKFTAPQPAQEQTTK